MSDRLAFDCSFSSGIKCLIHKKDGSQKSCLWVLKELTLQPESLKHIQNNQPTVPRSEPKLDFSISIKSVLPV